MRLKHCIDNNFCYRKCILCEVSIKFLTMEDKKTDVPATTTMKAANSVDKIDSKGVNVMTLNCNKAGMEGLDKEKINQIIEAASKGSKVGFSTYFAHNLKDQLLCYILVLQKETGGPKEVRQPGEGSSRHIEENIIHTIRSSQDRGRQVS